MSFERRICDFTSKPIDARDKASVQILVAELDERGRMTGEKKIIDLCGESRRCGNSDRYLREQFISN